MMDTMRRWESEDLAHCLVSLVINDGTAEEFQPSSYEELLDVFGRPERRVERGAVLFEDGAYINIRPHRSWMGGVSWQVGDIGPTGQGIAPVVVRVHTHLRYVFDIPRPYDGDIRHLRRQVEDRLRKSSPETIRAAAQMLGLI